MIENLSTVIHVLEGLQQAHPLSVLNVYRPQSTKMATNLNLHLRYSSFLVEFSGFFRCSVISHKNKNSFTSSFPIWMSFISSSFLIVLARTSNTMWNKGGKSRHLCLVPYLKGNACNFCLLSMMLAVDLSYMTFIMLGHVPSVPTAYQTMNWSTVRSRKKSNGILKQMKVRTPPPFPLILSMCPL